MAHILIVDDDEIVAEIAAGALIDAGHACGWVTGGEEALSLLSWRRPDLLLLDQDMPGMSGSEVLRSLRGSERHYDLPVIMFTGITGAEDEATALYNGAQEYLRKPFNPRFLLRKVDVVLSARARRPRHRDLRDVLEENAGWASDVPHRQRAI